MGRAAGLEDKVVYRQLARTYHPDSSELEEQFTTELFKFIGQQYDSVTHKFTF